MNSLLAAMSDADFDLLKSSFTLVPMTKGEPLSVPGERLAHSWFPLSGMASVVAATAGGEQAEVAVIGREGMFAVGSLHGIDWGTMLIFIQLPGEALRIGVPALRAAMAASPTLLAQMLAYAHGFMLQVANSALAFATLSIEQRLARWLLMTLDRLDGNDIALTHEALSLMLGARRAGVTVAIQGLEAKGALVARRAAVTIIDRSVLIGIAGDAYGAAEASHDRFIAKAVKPNGAGSPTA